MAMTVVRKIKGATWQRSPSQCVQNASVKVFGKGLGFYYQVVNEDFQCGVFKCYFSLGDSTESSNLQ
jgi:hypothetical protein